MQLLHVTLSSHSPLLPLWKCLPHKVIPLCLSMWVTPPLLILTLMFMSLSLSLLSLSLATPTLPGYLPGTKDTIKPDPDTGQSSTLV